MSLASSVRQFAQLALPPAPSQAFEASNPASQTKWIVFVMPFCFISVSYLNIQCKWENEFIAL